MATGTAIWLPSHVAEWLRREASRRDLKMTTYLATISGMPATFEEQYVKKDGVGPRKTKNAVIRAALYRLLLLELFAAGGTKSATEVGDRVEQKIKEVIPDLPLSWNEPIGPYSSRIRMALNFERCNAVRNGDLLKGPHGIWRLSVAGKSHAKKLYRDHGEKTIA